MNIFRDLNSGIKLYAGKYEVAEERPFTQSELEDIDAAATVASTWGTSVCLFLKSGYQAFIPLSDDSTVGPGQDIDPAKCVLLLLKKRNAADCRKIRYIE